MTTRNRFLFTILSALLLTACASNAPVLLARSSVTPVGIDLSGSWSLRVDPGIRRLPPQEEGVPIGPGQSRRSQQRNSRAKRGSKGMSAQVFIEYGENVKLTQTGYGLFISYDRSIVEEFTFGENRKVTIGPIEAQRVSGWDGRTFIAETLDRAGNVLRETWGFQDVDILVRNIRLMDGDKEVFSEQQIFDRK